MALELRNVTRRIGDETHIADATLTFEADAINVLLGPTLSGKTTLLRLMAGLDRPSSGSIVMDGKDVTGVSVRRRDVAMVYQQFINYPNLTVYENIASPLRVAGRPRAEIDATVRGTAELLKLAPLLDRMPLELSGGQQQRTALARALAKGARLLLLDEPLANLDYKLREELREELPRLFAETGAIFVYATTEPSEALLLGGRTAALHQGHIVQFGPTLDVFRQPNSLIAAQTFSDPPMNTVAVTKKDGRVDMGAGLAIAATGGLAGVGDGSYTVGFRANHLKIERPPGDVVAVSATVAITEISGSESFVHVDFAGQRWVALAHGIHEFVPGAPIEVFLDPGRFFVFDRTGRLAAAPVAAAAA